MSSSASSNTLVDRVSLRNLIDSARRLDELGVARVIANVAEVVHKQQKGGQPLGTVTPEAIIVLANGETMLQLGDAQAAYTAPEKLRGEPGDRRSDVFALGAILWEALSHERLFEGEIDGEIKAAVLEGEYRSAAEANANVPAELDAICKKALSRVPGDRYPSAKVLAAELATVLDDAGYPDDNTAIAEHLQTRYVPPEPKAAPTISSRATPIPGTPILPANQTIQGISPRKEIDAAIELTRKKEKKKEKKRETLVGPNETRPPAAEVTPLPAHAPLPETAPLVAMPEAHATSPSAQPLPSSTDAPRAHSPSKTPTLVGDNPLRAKAPSSQPLTSTTPVTDADRPKSPSESPIGSTPVGSLPSWATRPAEPAPMAPATAAALAAVSETVTEPGATLPGMPSLLDTPPPIAPVDTARSFSKTAVLGSQSGADIALPPAEPASPAASLSTPVPVGRKTEVHGSLAERLAAINTGNTQPPPISGLPAVPPGADPVALQATQPSNITTAETVATPSLDAPPLVPQPPILPGDKSLPPSAAVNMAAAATAVAVAPPDDIHPAAVVSLPRPRSKSEGGGVVRAGTEPGAVRDPVAGWGWGSGPHEAVGHDDDDYYDTQKSAKKRLAIAIGGAAAAVLLIVVAAYAFGGSKDARQPDVSAKQTEVAPAVDWSQPTEPPPAPPSEPVAIDPTAGSAIDADAGSADPNAVAAGSDVDPDAGSAAAMPPPPPPTEVAATEPAPSIEPPQVEPAKVEPPKDVAKVAPPPPPKKTPKVAPKVAKKEPKKLEPPKPVAKTASSWDPLKPNVKPAEPKKGPAPIDPYAAETPKKSRADASVAYKTGIQQFARGDSSGALSTFKASLASNPNFAPTWRGIGMVYEKLGKKSQAKTAFRRYLKLSPYAGDAESIRERMERL